MKRWIGYVQTRDQIVDLGVAQYPAAAIALARRKLNGNAAGACVGCRPAGKRAPSARFGAQLARALCGIQPSDQRDRRRINAALWKMEIRASRGAAAEAAARRARDT